MEKKRIPVFAAIEPCFMGVGGDVTVERRTPKILGENNWSGCYLHGKAEDLAGFDIPNLIDGDLEFLPEQEVLLETADGLFHECIFVAWERPSKRLSGLICLKDDEKSIQYARTCIGKEFI
jgi:hypothetical protein